MQRSQQFSACKESSHLLGSYGSEVRVYDMLCCRCQQQARAAGACVHGTCHGQMKDHHHERTMWVPIEAYLPHRPCHKGCKAVKKKPHLCCEEAANPRGKLALL